MGGLFIVAGLLVGLVVCGDLSNRYLQIAIFLTIGLAVVGSIDDWIKLRRRANGLNARFKLVGQIAVCAVAALFLYEHQTHVSLGIAFIPWAMLVMIGTSNAVNLTDGLDGLASGCLIIVTAALAIAAWWNSSLGDAREMLVLAGATIGVLLGFLRFNRHPAQVFMGDTGSLPLGGLLGLLAVATHQELLLAVVGAVFVVEAGSVILQVGYYKWRRRRIFLCAPLHHHFQFKGWPETRIVTRFWLVSAVCALLGLAIFVIPREVAESISQLPRTQVSTANLPVSDSRLITR